MKGLLVRASLELDEPVSRHPALRVSSEAGPKTGGGMVSPASLRPVGTGFTGPTAPDINNAKSRFLCWLLSRRYRTGLVSTSEMKFVVSAKFFAGAIPAQSPNPEQMRQRCGDRNPRQA